MIRGRLAHERAEGDREVPHRNLGHVRVVPRQRLDAARNGWTFPAFLDYMTARRIPDTAPGASTAIAAKDNPLSVLSR